MGFDVEHRLVLLAGILLAVFAATFSCVGYRFSRRSLGLKPITAVKSGKAFKAAALFLLIALTSVILARPVAKRNQPVVDYFFLAGISPSMRAFDYQDESGKPLMRLGLSKRSLRRAIDYLVDRPGARINLGVFGGKFGSSLELNTVIFLKKLPLNKETYPIAVSALENIDWRILWEGGSSFYRLLTNLQPLYSFLEYKGGIYLFVLDDGGEGGDFFIRPNASEEAVENFKPVLKNFVVHYTLSIVGIGNIESSKIPVLDNRGIPTGEWLLSYEGVGPATSKLEEGYLKSLAAATAGFYIRAIDENTLTDFIREGSFLKPDENSGETVETKEDLTLWLVPLWTAALIVFLLI